MKQVVSGCLALLVILCVTAAYAQGDAWKTLNTEFNVLYNQGQYSKAEVAAQKELQFAEQTFGPNHPNVAQSLNDLAATYYMQNKNAQANLLQNRALAIWHKSSSSTGQDTVKGLNSQALETGNQTPEAAAISSATPAVTLSANAAARDAQLKAMRSANLLRTMAQSPNAVSAAQPTTAPEARRAGQPTTVSTQQPQPLQPQLRTIIYESGKCPRLGPNEEFVNDPKMFQGPDGKIQFYVIVSTVSEAELRSRKILQRLNNMIPSESDYQAARDAAQRQNAADDARKKSWDTEEGAAWHFYNDR